MTRVHPQIRIDQISRERAALEERAQRDAREAKEPVEPNEVGRTLATLALDWRKRDGVLGIRRHEALRRTLAMAGKALGWDLLPGSTAERKNRVKKDIAELAEAGIELLKGDLTQQLARKGKEIALLKKVAVATRTLAEDPNTSYPAEVEISFTQRSALGYLVTKTETLALADATEALRAAQELESREESRTKLRDQMVEELKQAQVQLRGMIRDIPDFVESSDRLAVEMLEMPR